MKIEQVRACGIGMHDMVRAALSRLMAYKPSGSPAEQTNRATQEIRRFWAVLKAQIAWERQSVIPVLSEADAWGTVRADRLALVHKTQVNQAQAAFSRLGRNPGLLAQVASELRSDYERLFSRAETEFLAIDVLKGNNCFGVHETG